MEQNPLLHDTVNGGCFHLNWPLGLCYREIKRHKFNYPSSPLQITLKPIHKAHYRCVTLGIFSLFLLSLSLYYFIITAGSCHYCATSALHKKCEMWPSQGGEQQRFRQVFLYIYFLKTCFGAPMGIPV